MIIIIVNLVLFLLLYWELSTY